ncbi:F0F1 ATP synthase subunit delta [Spongisporangium articulatum]|uniref:ATP synthase subunit delta n=1 Tax=Spongisporangium articulatum TaxID=3362603 RepID=A0ABW8ATE1_9ACTN
MQGASRQSLAQAHEQLESLVAAGPRGGAPKADPAVVGDELFAVTGVLAGNPGLRRALTDPTRPAEAKSALAERLFGSLSAPTRTLLNSLVGSRWADPGDLVDATDELGVSAVLAGAQNAGTLDDVEDELFRFSRTVAADTGLRDAFSARSSGADRKAALVTTLLKGKATPQTTRLAVQAATAPRGVRTDQALESYLAAAAKRRSQLVAEVVAAVDLKPAQRTRLAASLQRIYDREIRLNVTVDPEVIGGLRILVAGELLDSTVLAKLGRAKRALAG